MKPDKDSLVEGLVGPARIDESNRYQYLIYLDKTVIIKTKRILEFR